MPGGCHPAHPTPGVDTPLVIRNGTRGGWQEGMVSSPEACPGMDIFLKSRHFEKQAQSYT